MGIEGDWVKDGYVTPDTGDTYYSYPHGPCVSFTETNWCYYTDSAWNKPYTCAGGTISDENGVVGTYDADSDQVVINGDTYHREGCYCYFG